MREMSKINQTKQEDEPYWADYKKGIREHWDVVVGDEVYFEDVVRSSIGIDRVKLTRNTGRVKKVFWDRKKGGLFYEIELTYSTGYSPRKLGTCKIISYLFLERKNPHRKLWRRELDRNAKRDEEENRRMKEDTGIVITKDGNVIDTWN